ncbi:hypothetical protein Tco_1523359 [Tanacetum coccineum]
MSCFFSHSHLHLSTRFPNAGRVFWGADEELSDGGSPRVIVYRYDGLHMQPHLRTEDDDDGGGRALSSGESSAVYCCQPVPYSVGHRGIETDVYAPTLRLPRLGSLCSGHVCRPEDCQTLRHYDYRIASQESLMLTLIAHVSSLHGQLSAALGQIQALQARDQTHADDHEGAGSSCLVHVITICRQEDPMLLQGQCCARTAMAVPLGQLMLYEGVVCYLIGLEKLESCVPHQQLCYCHLGCRYCYGLEGTKDDDDSQICPGWWKSKKLELSLEPKS